MEVNERVSTPEVQPEYEDVYKRIKPVQQIIQKLHDTGVERISKK